MKNKKLLATMLCGAILTSSFILPASAVETDTNDVEITSEDASVLESPIAPFASDWINYQVYVWPSDGSACTAGGISFTATNNGVDLIINKLSSISYVDVTIYNKSTGSYAFYGYQKAGSSITYTKLVKGQKYEISFSCEEGDGAVDVDFLH